MGNYFSYSDACGFKIFETLGEAKANADAILESERDKASNDLWDEAEVESIKYGMLIAECKEVSRVDKDKLTEDELQASGIDFNSFDSLVEYDLVE